MDGSDVRRFQRRRRIALVVLLVAIGLGGVAAWRQTRSEPVSLPAGVSQTDYDQAAEAFFRRYRRRPDHVDVLSWLGESAVRDKKFQVAVACFEGIPDSHPRYGCITRQQHGLALLQLNRAVEAEEQFKKFLQLSEGNPDVRAELRAEARDNLRFICGVELRFEERRGYLQANINAGYFDKFDLTKYCFPGLLRWNGPQAVAWLEEFYQQNPEDFRLRVALGRYRMGQGRLKESQQILEDCVQERPEDLAARAALLDCFREQGRWDRMGEIVRELPPPSPADPWLLLRLRGHVHFRHAEYATAMKCFQLALQADPASADACQGLARVYGRLGQQREQQELLQKARILARIQNRLGRIQETDDMDAFVETAELCEQIALHHFALLWAWWAAQADTKNPQARQLYSQLRGRYPSLPLPPRRIR